MNQGVHSDLQLVTAQIRQVGAEAALPEEFRASASHPPRREYDSKCILSRKDPVPILERRILKRINSHTSLRNMYGLTASNTSRRPNEEMGVAIRHSHLPGLPHKEQYIYIDIEHHSQGHGETEDKLLCPQLTRKVPRYEKQSPGPARGGESITDAAADSIHASTMLPCMHRRGEGTTGPSFQIAVLLLGTTQLFLHFFLFLSSVVCLMRLRELARRHTYELTRHHGPTAEYGVSDHRYRV